MLNKQEQQYSAKLLVLSAPSGSGKTTIARALLNMHEDFIFSVSATTRKQRSNERNGSDYIFLSKEEFEQRVLNNEFIEYENIYGEYYGTLKEQIVSALNNGTTVIFDVDVKGAISIKKNFPQETVLIFIVPPSMETLEQRLRGRKTETEERIQTRLNRVPMEMEQQREFDYVIINSDLQQAIEEIENIIQVQLPTNKQ
jgi:guanylate kinase